LMFFVVLALVLEFSEEPSVILSGTALALLAWNLFRARKELATALAAATRLDRTDTRPPL